jgi:hypothetical protein
MKHPFLTHMVKQALLITTLLLAPLVSLQAQQSAAQQKKVGAETERLEGLLTDEAKRPPAGSFIASGLMLKILFLLCGGSGAMDTGMPISATGCLMRTRCSTGLLADACVC